MRLSHLYLLSTSPIAIGHFSLYFADAIGKGLQTRLNYNSYIHRVRNFQLQSQLFVVCSDALIISDAIRPEFTYIFTIVFTPIGSKLLIAIATFCCDVPLPLRFPIAIDRNHNFELQDLSIVVYRPVGSGFSSQSQFSVGYILRFTVFLRLRLRRGPTI